MIHFSLQAQDTEITNVSTTELTGCAPSWWRTARAARRSGGRGRGPRRRSASGTSRARPGEIRIKRILKNNSEKVKVELEAECVSGAKPGGQLVHLHVGGSQPGGRGVLIIFPRILIRMCDAIPLAGGL